jgi:2,5-furandicarboxylate decarboxylase 1
VIVSKEVDPAYEITALVVKLEREARRRPVVLFEKVKGTPFPVLTNLHASRSRLALAMNVAPEDMLRTYLRAMERPIPPRVVPTGPVKDVVLTGARINLYDLPQIIHHERDAGPYITAAISFAKDPSGEAWNCAYNRLMIKGRDTTSIHLTAGKHLWEFHRIAEARARRCRWRSSSGFIPPSRWGHSPSARSTRTSGPSWAGSSESRSSW